MGKTKKILLRLLYPGALLTVILCILATASLIWVFITGHDEHPLAYAVYVISFYALCIFVAALVPLPGKIKKTLYRNRHIARYLTQETLRNLIGLYTSLFINLAFGTFKLVTSFLYHSIWFGAVGIYYMLLCVIRFLLLFRNRKAARIEEPHIRLLYGWKSYQICAILLLVLNIAMSGMVFQTVWQNKGYSYPGLVIYAVALHTFYQLTTAIINIFTKDRTNSLVRQASKALSLTTALMSLFALQTAMFSAFGMEMAEDTRRLMNGLTGGTVCFAVLCIAILMLLRVSVETKKIKEQSPPGEI